MCFLDVFLCSGVSTSYKMWRYFKKVLQPAEKRKKKEVSSNKEYEQEHRNGTFFTSWQEKRPRLK